MENLLPTPPAIPDDGPRPEACAPELGRVLDGLAHETGNRSRIMLEAARLFTRKGFAATSVREIVQAAGVTKPTLYYYYKNKDELFLNILDFALASYVQTLDTGIAAPGNARERVKAFLCSIFDLMSNNLDILRFVHAAFYGPEDSTPRYDLEATHNLLHSKLDQLLEGLAHEGELDRADAPAMAMLVHGLIEALQCQLMKPHTPSPTLEHILHCVDLLLDGGASRAAASPPFSSIPSTHP
jgi:AcrR family transcriptional regulator